MVTPATESLSSGEGKICADEVGPTLESRFELTIIEGLGLLDISICSSPYEVAGPDRPLDPLEAAEGSIDGMVRGDG